MDSLEESDLENFVDFFCTSELLVIYRPKSSEVSLMSAQLAVFVQLFLSLFSLFSSANLQNFRKVCLATEGMSQEVLYLPSVIFVSWQRRSLGMASLLSRRAYSADRLSSFYEEIEINL